MVTNINTIDRTALMRAHMRQLTASASAQANSAGDFTSLLAAAGSRPPTASSAAKSGASNASISPAAPGFLPPTASSAAAKTSGLAAISALMMPAAASLLPPTASSAAAKISGTVTPNALLTPPATTASPVATTTPPAIVLAPLVAIIKPLTATTAPPPPTATITLQPTPAEATLATKLGAAASALPSLGDGPAGPLFGANPWIADPTGGGLGTTTHYNPQYFASAQTAATIAKMVGGTVVAMNAIITSPGNPFTQDQPNLMVQLPNGAVVNPGLIAGMFTHGWTTSFVNQQVANEVANALPLGATT